MTLLQPVLAGADPAHVTPSAATLCRRAITLLLAAGLLPLTGSTAHGASSAGWSTSAGAGAVQPADGTPDRHQALLWSNGAASTNASGSGRLVLHARADLCAGAPQAEVLVDGTAVGRLDIVNDTAWWDYPVGPRIGGGQHRVVVRYLNDARTSSCDRNLRLGWVSFSDPDPQPVTAGVAQANPFVQRRPFVDPEYPSVRAAAARRGTDPVGAAALDRISAQTAALWAGDWYPTDAVDDVVRSYTTRAQAAGQTGVVVVYAIPGRDCGSHSAGGLTPQTYPAWVGSVAEGLRGTRTAVVLEPDALAQLGTCAGQGDRTGLLRGAVGTLTAAGATVYVDAGHSTWVDPDTMAQRLQAVGVDRARGFATNVSGTGTSADERRYAEQVSARTGGSHYVVDTSRNGAGSNGEWCNPTGRRLGADPAAVRDGSHQDATLWVKRVGESDGTCGGGPTAGQWWPDYAISLARWPAGPLTR